MRVGIFWLALPARLRRVRRPPLAYTAALANLAAAPSILGGTDYTLFWPLAM